MYGTGTSSTMFIVIAAIEAHIQLTKKDMFLDIGTGEGKPAHCIQFFCSVPDLRVIGYEDDPSTFARSKEILAKHPLKNVSFKFGDTSEVKSFAGVTIAYGYDGHPINFVECPRQRADPPHKTIMLRLFRTKSVRCVFSTKLNQRMFLYYFVDEKDYKTISANWTLVQIPALSFGMVGYCYCRVCCCCFSFVVTLLLLQVILVFVSPVIVLLLVTVLSLLQSGFFVGEEN
jgi:hypothetical protein